LAVSSWQSRRSAAGKMNEVILSQRGIILIRNINNDTSYEGGQFVFIRK